MKNSIIFCILFSNFSLYTSGQNRSTNYCHPYTIVIQMVPEVAVEPVKGNGRQAARIRATVFIPENKSSHYIACQFDYFQRRACLKQKWIIDNTGQQTHLDGIDNVRRVLITRKAKGKEEVIKLAPGIESALLAYFQKDVCHNLQENEGFDCYAFASLISNVRYNKAAPGFLYKKQEPQSGDFVVLSTTNSEKTIAVKHWALFLGDSVYLSKFGKTSKEAPSPLYFMTLESLKHLYGCKYHFVAQRKGNAKKWAGYHPSNAK